MEIEYFALPPTNGRRPAVLSRKQCPKMAEVLMTRGSRDNWRLFLRTSPTRFLKSLSFGNIRSTVRTLLVPPFVPKMETLVAIPKLP